MSCHKCGGPAPTSMCPCGEKVGSSKRELTLSWANEDTMEQVDWLMDDFIPARALTVLAGREGQGKTTLAGLWLADLTIGKMPGTYFGDPQKVLVIGAEDGWRSRWLPRLEALGADRTMVARDPSYVSTDEDGDPVVDLLTIGDPANLKTLAKLMHDNGIGVLYLDHLGDALKEGTDTNHYGQMTAALKRINRWSAANKVTTMGGWHHNKGEGRVQDMLNGSVGIRTSARCVLIMASDPESGLRFVAVDKCNDLEVDAPTTKARSFTIVEDPVTLDGITVMAKVPSGLAEADHTGSGRSHVERLANLAAMVERPTTAEGDFLSAEGWLIDFFTERGPKILKQVVLAWAEPHGYSERTIERAFTRLEGISTKVGREAQWELPPDTYVRHGRDVGDREGRAELSDVGGDPESATTSATSANADDSLQPPRGGGVYRRDVPIGTPVDLNDMEGRLNS